MWIILCVFCMIGAVELYGRIAYAPRQKRQRGPVYHLIPLDSSPAAVRRQLEYCLAWQEWDGQTLPLIFVHKGISTDTQALFEHYMGNVSHVRLCHWDTLHQTIFRLPPTGGEPAATPPT